MDASSSDVLRRVTRFKLQLADAAESATVLKILQKLKDLDITLDILAETGIGKIVNSLRRHEEAGEFAKLLVRDWKKLIPKSSTSHADDGSLPDFTSVKDKSDEQIIPNKGGLTTADSNNNCSTSQHSKSQKASEQLFTKADVEKQAEDHKRKKNQNGKSKLHSKDGVEHYIWGAKVPNQGEQMGVSVVAKEKKINHCNSMPGDLDHLLGNSEEIRDKSRLGSKEKLNSSSGCVGFGSDSEPDRKSKPPKQSTKYTKEGFSSEATDRPSKKPLNLDCIGDDKFSELSRSPGAPSRKRKKRDKEKHISHKQEELYKSQKKKVKTEHKNEQSDTEEPCMSFESYLNYDENVSKMREGAKLKKHPKKNKNTTVQTRQPTKDPAAKVEVESPTMSVDVLLPKKLQEFALDHADVQFPAFLENDKALGECIRRKDESDSCEVSEESAVFTGQRLNKKMQVYSGARAACLPAMMSLYQQCIRTLQNNINLIYETGGVPFEILQPVLERCTPEQLLRIEEFNPIYIGVTDHLWGKHCQRDFKDHKLLEYESWKEMYIRLSEEREKKFQRLTKTISSAHSKKPKGRQVKMAFIHTVAKPPRDVRIQQEIHGTAVQHPHQLRCSAKAQDNRTRPYSETTRPNRPSTETTGFNGTGSGTGSTQDPRKKTRVAPMMAKSLKAFKKQLGRR